MARTNTSGWLTGRVALAAATLVAGGALIASTSTYAPSMAWAEETAQAEGDATAAITTQVTGSYYLASAQGVVDTMNAARAEGAPLAETQALDAQAQARAAQYAASNIYSAQSADECVSYLAADQATDIAGAVEQMTSPWFTDGSPITNADNAYCGVALFQTEEGNLYLVAVFSNEAGNLSEGSTYVQAAEGTGLQEDGTEVPVTATMNVSKTVPASSLTSQVTLTQADGTEPQFLEPGMQLTLASTVTDADGAPVTLANATYEVSNPDVAKVEGDTLTVTGEGTADVTLLDGDTPLAAVSLTVGGDQEPSADENQQGEGEQNGKAEGDQGADGEQNGAEDKGENGDGGEAQEPAAEQITVTYNFNYEGSVDSTESQAAGSEFTIPTPEARDGYTFKGWNTVQNPTDENPGEPYNAGEQTFDTSTTLYAQWEENAPAPATQFTVSFDANGGSGEMPSVNWNANEDYIVPACIFTAPASNQVFDCWTVSEGDQTEQFDENDTYGLLSHNITFVAQWKDAPIAQATITFDANGGSGAQEQLTGNEGDKVEMPQCTFAAPDEGKEFAGWSDGTDVYPAGALYTLAGDKTLVAQWKDTAPAVQTVQVTYNGNGATGGAMEGDFSYENGSTQKVAANGFTRDGYRFAGWNTAADGTGKAYAEGDSITLDGDVTLYAQWVQLVSVTFDANGGQGSMSMDPADLGTTVTLPASTLTRDGYNFAGWNTAADGTGSAFVDGAQITLGSNVTLYAQWKTADTKYINGIQNNLTATTTAGVEPTLPATASVRWSDGSTSNEAVTWNKPANYAELYSKAGTFEVTGTVQGHSIKCTVTVNAAADQQKDGIAKTGDQTDYTPIVIAAGVGIVVVILAVVLIIRSRNKK